MSAALLAPAVPAHAVEANARLVRDIQSGSRGSTPTGFVDVRGTTFFSAHRRGLGEELWRTDGTRVGTRLVKDIWPERRGSYPQELTRVGRRLFFRPDDGTTGRELWVTDGTRAGTRMVKDIEPGPESSWPGAFSAFRGKLFFTTATDRRLWKSDGTRAGTVPVKRVRPRGRGLKIGDTLFFPGSGHGTGTELWKTDGTERGTVLVKDIDTSGSSRPQDLTRMDGVLYFTACESAPGPGRTLWRSDGTKAGTWRVKDASVAEECNSSSGDYKCPNYPALLTPVRGTLYFVTDYDFSEGINSPGCELWKSDGTEAGTALVRDINVGGHALPRELTAVGGAVFFSADDGVRGRELWKSDGTEEGTVLVKDIAAGPDGGVAGASSFFRPANRRLVGVEGTLFFVADDGSTGWELWMSDGTEAGTVLVEDIRPGGAGSDPYWLYRVGSGLLFGAYQPETGRELWKASTLP